VAESLATESPATESPVLENPEVEVRDPREGFEEDFKLRMTAVTRKTKTAKKRSFRCA